MDASMSLVTDLCL